MTCPCIDDAVLGDLGEAWDAHTEQCPECRAYVRDCQRIARLIATGVTAHRPPPDWHRRTLARVLSRNQVYAKQLEHDAQLASCATC